MRSPIQLDRYVCPYPATQPTSPAPTSSSTAITSMCLSDFRMPSSIAICARPGEANRCGATTPSTAASPRSASGRAEVRHELAELLGGTRPERASRSTSAPSTAWAGPRAPAGDRCSRATTSSAAQALGRVTRGRSQSSNYRSSWVPCAAMRPSSSTTISSASAIVERRWAMIRVVRPAMTRAARPGSHVRWTHRPTRWPRPGSARAGR